MVQLTNLSESDALSAGTIRRCLLMNTHSFCSLLRCLPLLLADHCVNMLKATFLTKIVTVLLAVDGHLLYSALLTRVSKSASTWMS